MRKKRFLTAILMVLLTSLFSTCWAQEKYATWIPAFSIDKAWQFNSSFEYFPLQNPVTNNVRQEKPLDNTSLVDFPGQIAWVTAVKGFQGQKLEWGEIWLVNSSTRDSIQLVKLFFDTDGHYDRPYSIANKNGCTTAQTNCKIYEVGEGYQYFHTLYGDVVRNFITTAGSNLQLKINFYWDRGDSFGGRDRSSTSTLDAADRQLISLPPQPVPSDIAWTVHDTTTCIAFKPGVTSTDGVKLKLEELENSSAGCNYESFSSDSNCYYHYSQIYYPYEPFNLIKDYLAFGMYIDKIRFNIHTEKTYSYSTDYYFTFDYEWWQTRNVYALNGLFPPHSFEHYHPYELPNTTTLSSGKVLFSPPILAWPEGAKAVDNKNATVTLTWYNLKNMYNNSFAYDSCNYKVERDTNSAFTDPKTYDVPFIYEGGCGQTYYTLIDSFDMRDEGNKTFYYRIYREHAQKTELNAETTVGVNTNYSRLSHLEATTDTLTNNVNLKWYYTGGVKNSELKLRISYGDTIIERNHSDSVTEIKGIDDITPCVPTQITAQLYAGDNEYSFRKQTTVTVPSTDVGVIDTLTADAGYFNDKVNIRWKVSKTRHNFSSFQLLRKIHGDSVETSLTNQQFVGGHYDYSYTDNTCIPGVYYEYKLKCYATCDDSVRNAFQESTIGFAQPFGVVSGQIAYSGNQAVEGVTVTAQCEGTFSGKSISFIAADHPKLQIPANSVAKVLGNTAGTIEFFVRLHNTATYNPIVECGDRFKLSNQNNKLKLTVSSAETEVDNALFAGDYSHIAITYDNQNVTLYLNGDSVATLPASQQVLQAIKFGFDNTGYMTGNLDEIRVWNTTRSQMEIKDYSSTYLAGNEEGLKAYYRCDDDISFMLFDISKNGSIFNGNHLRMDNITIDNLSKPTPNQLGLKVFTNKYGNYLFNNIPYSAGGTLYNIIPTFGQHEFSPAQRPLFFNSTAVTHNAVDFEDVSNFTVEGRVTFYNTNYPVEGCELLIDGTPCLIDEKPVKTDAKGEYKITVPIGKHAITVKKAGHTFVNNGRFPATGKRDFNKPITGLNFQDSTFVILAGRVAGGSDEGEKPHGFGRGIATLGQAIITLGTQGDIYNLNLNPDSDRTFGMPDTLWCDECSSVATTGRAYQNLAHNIKIKTDSVTGEFYVLLPPIDFVVKKVELKNNPDNLEFPMWKIKNPELSSVTGNNKKDSVGLLEYYFYFNYAEALDIIYTAEPTMTVQQNTNDKAFGAPRLTYNHSKTKYTEAISLYTIDSLGNINYTFGYPCFSQDSTYDWKITAFETYVNHDTQDTTRQPFRYGIVTVNNTLGTMIPNKEALTDTTIISGGKPIKVSGNQLLLDSTGTTYYSFTVGEPNVMRPFRKSFQITYQDSKRLGHYNWDGNNSRNEGIILGTKILGTSFLTEGPDEIFYILRSPLSTGSSATWQSGETITKTISNINQKIKSKLWSGSVNAGIETCIVAAPFGVGTVTHLKTTHEITTDKTTDNSVQWSTSKTWRYTNSETVSTTIPGSKGDIFIGMASNQLYGKSQRIFVTRDTLGQYKIDVVDEMAYGSRFTTKFQYTQDDILNNQIPKLITKRNHYLHPVPAYQYDDTSYTFQNDSVLYITKLSESDPNYGKNDTYRMIVPNSWPNDSTPPDMVCVYNNMINRWYKLLEHNEHCKVIVRNSQASFDSPKWEQAFNKTNGALFRSVIDTLDSTDIAGSYLDKVVSDYQGGWLIQNHSLGYNGNISCSETREYSTVGGVISNNKVMTGKGGAHTLTVNNIGTEIDWNVFSATNITHENDDGKTRTSTVSYNVSIGRYDVLSFDVYQSPDGFGPIFIARAGNTSCPHVKQEMTRFYEPGQHEIQPATVASFKPQLEISNSIVSNVPYGKKAIFNIKMSNTSTEYGVTNFRLRQLGETNPKGAILKIDGMPITEEGRLFPFNASDSIWKTLELTATREDELNYDSIALALETECWKWDADTVKISAHFMPSCSDINLSAKETIINSTTDSTVTFTIDGFDKNYRSFNNIQLQYQGPGTTNWSMLKQFRHDTAAVIKYTHKFTQPQHPDGTYKFRAVTQCTSGYETILNESEEVTVVVDFAAPVALGKPYPLGGIYTADNQIYVEFNEPIQTSRIIRDNVTVEGVLNGHDVNHAVALSLDNNTAVSNATYNLGTTPFTLEMYINYSAPGTIFSYAGGGANGIEFAVDANNKLVATIKGTSFTSSKAMKPNEWLYLMIMCDVANNKFEAYYAWDSSEETLFANTHFTAKPAASGNIRFGGKGFNAKVHDIVLWNTYRTQPESLAGHSATKTSYTPGLLSLWYCNEGKGTIVSDVVRQRNLTLSADAWAYSHVNHAMHVAAGETASVNLSGCSISKAESYLIEMWFRTSGDAELFHLGDNSITVSIANGNLVVNNQTLTTRNYQHGVWHHLAIIKPTLNTPVIAIDGKQLPSLDSLPAFKAGSLVLGNTSNAAAIDIDEIRLWDINTTLESTRLRMNTCVDSTESGLVAYYPMETYQIDQSTSQGSTQFSLVDKKDPTNTRAITHSNLQNAQSNSAPALLEVSPKQNVSHDFTPSDTKIVVNIKASPQSIEGCSLDIVVKDIRDVNDNYSKPIRWTVFVNRNQLLWDNNSFTIVKDEVVDTTFNLTIVNNSSSAQTWSIDNIPECMTLSETTGSIPPLQTKTIQCTINASAARGETEHILYLKGNEHIECPLYITTKVYANKPNWSINPATFENSMSIIGYVEVNGIIADDEQDMMAAFVDNKLAGVANLRLLPAMGRYYIMMTIFHNDSTRPTPNVITFRYWDASSGMIYSDVQLYSTTGGTMRKISNLKFETNTILGSINEPLRILMGDEIEQVLDLNMRWNWISFNVEPAQKSIDSIMYAYMDDFTQIKSQNGFSQPDRISGKIVGNIGNMDCKTGYKLQVKRPFELQLSGFAASLDSVINLKAQRWTWFGYLPQKAMAVNDAMSNINPTVGDLIKSKSQFATWDGYQWIGSLEVMCPGQGYVYHSYSTDDVSFTYPDYAKMSYQLPAEREEILSYFDPIDPGMYQGNMNITAVVRYNGAEVTTAEIGVFADSECRASATYNQGFYFITVPGDSTVNLTFKVLYNDSIYTLQGSMTYRNDAIVGSAIAPLVIELTSGVVPDSPTDDNGEPLSVVSVEAVKDAKLEKVLIDNEVFIIKDGKMYDIHGRRRK